MFPTREEIIELAEILKWSMAGTTKVHYLDDEGVERKAVVRALTRYQEDVREEMIRFTTTTGSEIFYRVGDVLRWKMEHRIRAL